MKTEKTFGSALTTCSFCEDEGKVWVNSNYIDSYEEREREILMKNERNVWVTLKKWG